jgi:hypothetical protein
MDGTNERTDWWTDQAEVQSFAQVLADAGSFDGRSTKETIGNVLHYFEKPWNWSAERAAWIAAGRPEEFDFLAAAEAAE